MEIEDIGVGEPPSGGACEEPVEAYHLEVQLQTVSGGKVDYRKYGRGGYWRLRLSGDWRGWEGRRG